MSEADNEAMNVFVAATLDSGPAAIGSTNSQVCASGLSVSLTMAAVIASAERAAAAASIRSSLHPDCEMVRNSWPLSASRR